MKSPIDNDILELAWSLWSELGIPGWTRHHQDVFVDPEALIVFSASLDMLDGRLRDEVAGWCISFDRLISKTRLRNLARSLPATAVGYSAFARLLNKHGVVWPTVAESDTARAHPRSRAIDRSFVSRPSALALRIRGLFGLGSRAEVLRALVAYPDTPLSAPELAVYIQFARRNVAEALDALELAGVVASLHERRTVRYVLARSLEPVVGQMPRHFPHWPELLGLLLDLRQVLAGPKATPLLRAIEAQRFLESHAFAIARNGLRDAPEVKPGYETWSHLEKWAGHVVDLLATNRGGSLRTPRLRPTFIRVRASHLPSVAATQQ